VVIGGNRLLARVDGMEGARIASAFESVHLARGHVIASAGMRQQHVYFPASCLISVFVDFGSGRGAYVGLIGTEGFAGLSVLLQAEPIPHRLVCQIGGDALRMPAQRFERLVRQTVELRHILLQYAGVRLVEETHHLACMATHAATPRVARWLLITRDRVGSDKLSVTHEFLAKLLGVRRPYVTGIMRDFQRDGHIGYRRGQISIQNEAGLASAACEDYWHLRSMYDGLCNGR
jgi:CRP-like cAMP-binding protein